MENQPQLRVVEGRQEIYDNTLHSWRGVTPLDRIKPSKDPKRPFVCQNCGNEVDVKRYTRGWDVHQIDPESGYITEVIDEEIEDIDIEEYRCSEGCGWTGNHEWFREMQDGEQREKVTSFDIEAPEQIPDTKPTTFHRFVWRNATPDPF